MSSIFWWILQVILLLLFCVLLVFGIILLISAYQLKDPFWFIMTFFASNLIILINGALLVGLVLRMLASYRKSKVTAPTQSPPLSKIPTVSVVEGGGPAVSSSALSRSTPSSQPKGSLPKGSAEQEGGGEK